MKQWGNVDGQLLVKGRPAYARPVFGTSDGAGGRNTEREEAWSAEAERMGTGSPADKQLKFVSFHRHPARGKGTDRDQQREGRERETIFASGTRTF